MQVLQIIHIFSQLMTAMQRNSIYSIVIKTHELNTNLTKPCQSIRSR